MRLGLHIGLGSSTSAGGGAAWTPTALAPMIWYDPSDLTTLFQDTSATIPVTTDGQSVARMNDKSINGRDATQSDAAKRPAYRTSGGLHWLEFDGVDDHLLIAGLTTQQLAVAIAMRSTNATASSYRSIVNTISTGSNGLNLLLTTGSNNWGTWAVSDFAASSDIRSPASAHVIMMDGTSSGTFYRNGATDGTYAATRGQDAARIGGNPAYGQCAAMNLYGLVMCSAPFGAARTSLTTYLGEKAGLTL